MLQLPVQLPKHVIALCRLQSRTMQALADSIRIAKANLLAAMSNRRPLPGRYESELWKSIGLDSSGRLRTDMVHRWRARTADDLLTVIDSWSLVPEIYSLRSPGQPDNFPTRVWLLASLVRDNSLMYAIVDTPDVQAIPSTALRDFNKGTIQLEDPEALLREPLAIDLLDRLRTNLLASTKPEMRTWADFVRAAENVGLTPERTWELLEKGRQTLRSK